MVSNRRVADPARDNPDNDKGDIRMFASLTRRRLMHAAMIALLMLMLTALVTVGMDTIDQGVALAQDDDDDDDDGEAPVGGVETGAGGTAGGIDGTLVAGMTGLAAAGVGAGLYARRWATE